MRSDLWLLCWGVKCYSGRMTEDQLLRGAITGASVPLIGYLFQKAKTHLSESREKHGRGLVERVSYRLGTLWAARHSATK